ncbi:unnamed protein product [Medioppia subpectinata]|uniref:Uncharacterized protein n=1 Tax=Medioppia subpectinata TaxID=1979941 RepID=A0A7R9QMN8_9ACAR|nr:unnamed protein product [Medioppia subpectinata]CAG2122932.1 unnamed protein product [Medioppia subpectinata]
MFIHSCPIPAIRPLLLSSRQCLPKSPWSLHCCSRFCHICNICKSTQSIH